MDLDEYRRSLGLRLTPKQRLFAESYVANGGDAPEAALAAYDCASRESARVLACRALHNEKVLDYLGALMQPGHLVDAALDGLSEALKATKRQRGKPTDHPDWSTRLRAARPCSRCTDCSDPPIRRKVYTRFTFRRFRRA